MIQAAAALLTGFVALLHLLFLILEMFLWRTPIGQKVFHLTPEFAAQSAALAKNQGLYNGILAAGLIWSFFILDPTFQASIRIFFLTFIVIAGTFDANDTKALLKEIHLHFIPNKIVLLVDGTNSQKKLASILQFVEGMRMQNGKATAYVCENYACQLPTSEKEVVAQLLSKSNIKKQK